MSVKGETRSQWHGINAAGVRTAFDQIANHEITQPCGVRYMTGALSRAREFLNLDADQHAPAVSFASQLRAEIAADRRELVALRPRFRSL
jgi:hypothetical protein